MPVVMRLYTTPMNPRQMQISTIDEVGYSTDYVYFCRTSWGNPDEQAVCIPLGDIFGKCRTPHR